MAIQRFVEPATIYLVQRDQNNERITENLGVVPFEQANILGDINDTATSAAIEDICDFTMAVHALTSNTMESTKAKYEVDISNYSE